ncbi:MAG: aminodeoxychorismate/anthranilate synthase component II [Pirellula sp.]|jgi:anthranilate synthase component 2|nr:aminodeoxychorismate/anthranilate synthase component II [Pirellula sp.]
MILLLDNYDSFVYNLDRYLRRLGQATLVVRSDSISVDSISRLNISAIVISPGPKTPNDAGCSLEVIRKLGKHVPILGVCLGHQAIGQAFGAKVVRAPAPCHGKTSTIEHSGAGLFRDVPSPTTVGRYHSLILDRASIPDCLQVTAWTADGLVMGVQHREHPIHGLQFHPESILTDHGYHYLRAFLRSAGLPFDDIANHELLPIAS